MDEIKISISVNPVRTDLLSQLLESLANEGFTLKKSDNCISRKTETGFEQIGFVIYNYWPHCVEIGQAVFSVRFDAVEKIIAPIDVANGLRSDLHGAGKDITIFDYIDYEKQIFTQIDLDNFIRMNILTIKEKGIVFFQEHRKLSDINEYYKNTVLVNTKGIGNGWRSISISLTSMKLCGDKEFEKMKISYRHILKPDYGMEEKTFAAYDDLVNYLSGL